MLNDDKEVTCRSYQKIGVRETCQYNKPSGAYHKVILDGAVEHGLPSSYIQKLESIENNGIFDIPMLQNIENNEKEEREPEPVL